MESLHEVENEIDIQPILDRKRSHRPDRTTTSDNSSDENEPPPHSAPKLSQSRCRSTSTKTFKKVWEFEFLIELGVLRVI